MEHHVASATSGFGQSDATRQNDEIADSTRSNRKLEDMLAAEREARLRAEESERRFRATADAAPVLMWSSGRDSLCDWFNQPWLEFTGRTMEEQVRGGWSDDIHPDDLQRCVDIYTGSFSARQPFSMEFRLRRRDGEYRWVLCKGVPRYALTDGIGSQPAFLGYIVSCIDVTDQRLTREALEAANTRLVEQQASLEQTNRDLQSKTVEIEAATRQLQATMAALEERTETAESAQMAAEAAGRAAESANRAKSDFLAMMSHEFRTPLNAMIGYTQLLDVGLAGPLTEQQRSYLKRMTSSTEHLLWLVNDVLDLSKIEAGEARVARTEAFTGSATRSALDLVEPVALSRDVRILNDCPDGVAYVGDELRLRQIIVNLLTNAVKFTGSGGTVTIRCDAQLDPPPGTYLHGPGPWSYVRVEDTGVGIAPEEQTRIFQAFHQVEGGRTRKEGGTGLGLAISRQLAHLMGGDLTVESTPGVGSIFTLWLPGPRDPEAAKQVSTEIETEARAEREVVSVGSPGLREVGELLAESVNEILAGYSSRLRDDPEIPRAREMRKVLLEDHAVSLISDLAQSLIIVADAGPEAADLLRDGSLIQRAIAESHGARRYAQKWDRESVRRDHGILREEIQRVLRERLGEGNADTEGALRVLSTLNERAEAISMRSWRRAAEAAAAGSRRP